MHKIIISTIIAAFLSSASLCLAKDIKTEDKNGDGRPDMWIYYENEIPVKIESDRNYDNKLDLWIIYGKNASRTTQVDLNFDGRPDMYSYYQYGRRVKLEIDADYDGKLDQVNEYSDGRLVKMQKDENKDGKLDVVFDITGRVSSQQKHTQYYETHTQPLENSKALSEKQKPQ